MISDPLELNYTKVRAYLNCPHLYKYLYLERKFSPHTPFSSLGISVHRALDRYHERGGDLGDMMLYYDEGWLNQGYQTPQQSLEFYHKGRKILENYWLAEKEGSRADVVFTEKDFEFQFERWLVKGTMDRVDRIPGGHEIIDYKMGFEEKTAADLADDLQLAIYALGLKRSFSMDPKLLSWVLLIKGEKISVPYDPATEAKTLDTLRSVGEKILALDLSHKGNCQACSIRKLCALSESRE